MPMSNGMRKYLFTKIPIVLFVISFVFFLFVLFRLVLCTAEQVEGYFAIEQLDCVNEVHDFGTILQGDRPEFTFILKNSGRQVVSIEKVIPGCGACVRIKQFSSEPIGIGEITKITAILLTEYLEGEVEKAIIVKYGKSHSKMQVLYLKAFVCKDTENGPDEK